jgi:DNA-binding NtrC family response regulator
MIQPIHTPAVPPVRVLVVENDSLSRELLARVLRRHGCRARTAVGGDQALSTMADASHAYDLLITDLDMQPMDGVELLRRVSELPPDRRPHHLAVLSGCLPRYYAALRELPWELHLFPKPLHLPTFLGTLAAVTPIPLAKTRRPHRLVPSTAI